MKNNIFKNIIIGLAIILSLSACAQKINQNSVLSDLKLLSSDQFEGRKTGTIGAEMAANMISKRFRDIGIDSFSKNFSQSFTFERKLGGQINGKNIIGYIKGKTDETIVISAHYDHLGIINNKVFNGADDDASGICALLEYAKHFKKHQPQHSLIFIAYDAEELGLQGSKYFVLNPPIPIKNIAININMDMIAHNDKNELYVCGTYQFPDLKQFVFTTKQEPKILFGHDDPKLGNDDWTFQSDQGSFYEKKIPFIYFGVEDHKDYHKETDEFKNINQVFYLKSVAAILEIINHIDKNSNLQSIMKSKQIMN